MRRETQPPRPRPADPALRRRGHHAVHRRSGRAIRRSGLQGPEQDPPRSVRVCHTRAGAGGATMMRPFEHLEELRALLDALCEETIDAEQVRRLEELVLAHPEAEACYVQSMSLHADLL